MTPSTTASNLSLYVLAGVLAILLAGLVELTAQLPSVDPINVRVIVYEMLKAAIVVIPSVGAAAGLPRVGKEEVASLTSHLGTASAVAALQVAADVQVSPPAMPTVSEVADELERRLRQG